MDNTKPSRTKQCKICGCEFAITKQERYIASDNDTVGFGAAFGSKREATIYDAFDCPNCGCQMIIQPRKRAWGAYTDDETDTSNIDDGK